MVKISQFDYQLPATSIALEPPKKRGDSRLLVLSKHNGDIQHRKYNELAKFLRPGDVLILNDTKVIKARLVARNSDGKTRELLLLEDHHNTDFTTRKALYRGKIRPGEKLKIGASQIIVDEIFDGGIAKISANVNLLDLAEKAGSVPLPPYMHRESTDNDTKRYQTVFARDPGSVAAPTASLNFTHQLEASLTQKGVQIAYLTLHVGLGTFLPIRSDEIEKHDMHSEYYEIPTRTVKMIQNARKNNGRIVALGTTVSRTLEYAADRILQTDLILNTKVVTGEANIFIYPGYSFKLVDALLTNFHAPKSTVLMMAAAFAGWPNLKNAYQNALDNDYQFLSYGDSMLILNE
jgi:S-adenosylmethionine:tRNA ribosyltransferase-isomerase